jgi:hypothetical protein
MANRNTMGPTEHGSANESLRLAYLDIVDLQDQGGCRGGLLVVDAHGYPLEFYVTNAIKPSRVQRVIYGRGLRVYVLCELMASPLLASLAAPVCCVIVHHWAFVRMRPATDTALVGLCTTEDAVPPWASFVPWSAGKARFFLAVHKGYESDAKTAIHALERMQDFTDPTEPFERIEAAIRYLGVPPPSRK